MTILVDIDSTITNFGEMLLNACNNYYKTNHQYKEITSYDWFDKTFKDPWFVTDCFSFWDEVAVNPEAVSVIESWIKQKHKVLLVTASHFSSTLGYKIKKTLEAFNPKLINERNVVIAQDKSIVMGDAMIDDCVDNLNSFNRTRICFAQPWNRKWRGLRSYSWEAIDKIVQNSIFCLYEEQDGKVL